MHEVLTSRRKRPLAFLLAISENLGFAAGNVALGLYKYMADEDYDLLIYYSTLHDRDRAALERIPRVRLVPFSFEERFLDLMLQRLPAASRFRDAKRLMCFCHFEAFALLSQYNCVVWLDADIAIQGNLAQIRSFRPFGITADSPWTVQQSFTRPIDGYEMNTPGWCTAVMAVHDELPYERLYQWCYDKAAEYADCLVNPDQAIIDIALQEFAIIPSEMPHEIWQCVPWREQASTALIVHFGTERKVWSDSNVFNVFPEWHRLHREWLGMGGRDFDRSMIRARSALPALDELDQLTGEGRKHWSAPAGGTAETPSHGLLLAGARRLYLGMRLYDGPPGSVSRATHGLVDAVCRKTGILPTVPAVRSGDRPNVAFRLRGGLGDHLIAARYIRDLAAAAGKFEFDVFSSRPQIAAWIFANTPTLSAIYNEHLTWEASLTEYSLPIHLQQYIYLYLDRSDCRKALRDNGELARVCESIERHRYLIEEHITTQPRTDHVMAQQAVLRGWNRFNLAHKMSGLAYGGHTFKLDTDPSVLEHHDLLRGPYITIHNASDEDFMIGRTRMGDRPSTKIYPHFDRLIALLRARLPAIKVVHLGTASSRSIGGVDLDLRGRCSIQATAGVLSNARFHIDVESGMVHLAACLGVRSCVLFGPTSLEYFGYDTNVNIPPATCGNCWWLTPDWMMNCAKGYARQKCLDDIQPATIVEVLAPELQATFEARDLIGAGLV